MKFLCIADEDTVRGFRLAGIEGLPARTPAQAADLLEQAARRPDVGILVLTEDVAEGIRAQLDAFRQARDRPLVVEIPGPAGPSPSRAGLHRIVQAAVGIRVREEG